VISPAGAGLIDAVSTMPCARDSDARHVVIGTTLEAVLIKAAITANSTCLSRLGLLGTRLTGCRAAPLICGSARKSSGDSR
jgi:hypothetical protein